MSLIKHNGALKLILIVFILSEVSAFKSSVLNQRKKFPQVIAIPENIQVLLTLLHKHLRCMEAVAMNILSFIYFLFAVVKYCLSSVHLLRCKRNKTYLPLLRKYHQPSAYGNSRPNRLHHWKYDLAGDMP